MIKRYFYQFVDYIISNALQRVLWSIAAKLALGIAQALIVVTLLDTSTIKSSTAALFAVGLIATYIYITLHILKTEV